MRHSPPSSSHSSPCSSSSVPQLLFRGSAWSPPPASHHPAALHLHYWVLFLQVPFVFYAPFLQHVSVLFRGRPSSYFIAKVHVVEFERNYHLNAPHPSFTCNKLQPNNAQFALLYLESPSKDLGEKCEQQLRPVRLRSCDCWHHASPAMATLSGNCFIYFKGI